MKNFGYVSYILLYFITVIVISYMIVADNLLGAIISLISLPLIILIVLLFIFSFKIKKKNASKLKNNILIFLQIITLIIILCLIISTTYKMIKYNKGKEVIQNYLNENFAKNDINNMDIKSPTYQSNLMCLPICLPDSLNYLIIYYPNGRNKLTGTYYTTHFNINVDYNNLTIINDNLYEILNNNNNFLDKIKQDLIETYIKEEINNLNLSNNIEPNIIIESIDLSGLKNSNISEYDFYKNTKFKLISFTVRIERTNKDEIINITKNIYSKFKMQKILFIANFDENGDRYYYSDGKIDYNTYVADVNIYDNNDKVQYIYRGYTLNGGIKTIEDFEETVLKD